MLPGLNPGRRMARDHTLRSSAWVHGGGALPRGARTGFESAAIASREPDEIWSDLEWHPRGDSNTRPSA